MASGASAGGEGTVRAPKGPSAGGGFGFGGATVAEGEAAGVRSGADGSSGGAAGRRPRLSGSGRGRGRGRGAPQI